MSIEFVGCYPAANSYFITPTQNPYPPSTVAVATIASAHTDSLSLSPDPKRMVVIKVWGLLNK